MKLQILLILSLLLIAGCSQQKLIGGDKDEHGCLIAAGYSWCEVKQQCIRSWEENCGDFCGTSKLDSCNSNEDCVVGGCSSQICQSKDNEPSMSTCEYQSCYNPVSYNLTCKCVNSQCKWNF
ncbi:MAG: eight-cysteine-cluster domain-containing protein [Candidatus Nanoarchaeia archaeon]|nr:eight-cysteine-cluster domain-containing protein [Candidatus Nanoarchaeia archaeon]